MRSYPPSIPRSVQGGLRTRDESGEGGATWWSRRFIDALESFALGSRLSRGRDYARAGQVLALEIMAGTVSAAVQGSRARPYQVSVALAPFSALVWAKVEVALAEQAIHSARLLAGEMTPDLEDVFGAAGAPLFPRQLDELGLDCTCPDSEVPCKHLAATFYLLAEAFDTDPFQILAWRGRSREALLERLRALRADGPAEPEHGGPPPDATAPATGAAIALADLADPHTDLDRFWFSPVPLPARPTTLVTAPGLLLRALPTPGPQLGGARLVDVLTPAYERFHQVGQG